VGFVLVGKRGTLSSRTKRALPIVCFGLPLFGAVVLLPMGILWVSWTGILLSGFAWHVVVHTIGHEAHAQGDLHTQTQNPVEPPRRTTPSPAPDTPVSGEQSADT